MIKQFNNLISICFIGENNSGKTSIIKKILNNNDFLEKKEISIGIDYYKKINEKNKKYNIDIWDISGGIKYLNLSYKIILKMNKIFYVHSFDDNISIFLEWEKSIKNLIESNKYIVLLTKKDKIQTKHKKNLELIKKRCLEIGIKYFEISCKENSDEMIELIYRLIE